jgi:hypothetical protein
MLNPGLGPLNQSINVLTISLITPQSIIKYNDKKVSKLKCKNKNLNKKIKKEVIIILYTFLKEFEARILFILPDKCFNILLWIGRDTKAWGLGGLFKHHSKEL